MALTKITSHVIGSGAVTASSLSGITTDTISEGSSNTYFTNARARGAVSVTGGNLSYDSSSGVIQLTTGTIRAQLSGGTGVTYNSTSGAISIGQSVATDATPTFGNTTLTGYLRGPSTFTIDPATHGDDTGTVVIAGNLQVDGTTTTINSTTLTVDDKLVTLASGSANAGAAHGAGIEVDISGATNPSLLYDGTNDQWDFNKPVQITNNTTDDTLLLKSTEDSNLAAPVLTFERDSSSPADADYLGQLKFRGENDADQDVVYAKMTSKISDASDGSEDGTLEFAVRKAGTNNINMRLGPNSLQIINGTNLTVGALTSGKTGTLTINNEGGNTATLRVLSRTNRSVLEVADNDTNGYISAENAIFSIGRNSGLNSANINIDSSNRVGIGTSSPGALLDLTGVTASSTPKLRFTGTGNASAGDAVGQIDFYNSDDTDNTAGVMASIKAIAGPSGGEGHLQFLTDMPSEGAAAATVALHLHSNAYVGIGTSSPTGRLHISGNSDVSDEDCMLIIDDVDGSAGSRIPAIMFRSNTGGNVTNHSRIRGTGTQGLVISGSAAMGDDLVVQAGKVGIGTTSPNRTLNLHVAANDSNFTQFTNSTTGAVGSNGFLVGIGSAGNAELWNYEAQPIIFATSSTERARIDSSGNFGIGTNSPDVKLDVRGEIAVGYHATYGLRFYNQGRSNWSSIGNFATNTTADLNFKTGGGLAMTITHAKNVGIGTSSPGEKLEVNGVINIKRAGDHPAIRFMEDTTTRAYIGSGDWAINGLADDDFGISSSSTGDLVLGTGAGSERMRLTNTGRVGIAQSSPQALLHVDGASSSIAALMLEGNGNGDTISLQLKAKANNGTLSYHGLTASPGSDQDDNTISLGNGGGNGVVVDHKNVVTARFSKIHNGGTFTYDTSGSYLGANGAGFGTHAIFRTPSVSSPSNAAASTQFLTVYSSGHWGEYPVCRFRVYTTYYTGAYREYLFRMSASNAYLNEVTAYSSTTSWGHDPATITKGSVTDTGTDHAGQNIYKCELTFTSGGTYLRDYVVTEIAYGANRYFGSGTAVSTVDADTSGGKYHFKTISSAEGRGIFE